MNREQPIEEGVEEDRDRPFFATTSWSIDKQSPGERSLCLRTPNEVLGVDLVEGEMVSWFAMTQARHKGRGHLFVSLNLVQITQGGVRWVEESR